MFILKLDSSICQSMIISQSESDEQWSKVRDTYNDEDEDENEIEFNLTIFDDNANNLNTLW